MVNRWFTLIDQRSNSNLLVQSCFMHPCKSSGRSRCNISIRRTGLTSHNNTPPDLFIWMKITDCYLLDVIQSHGSVGPGSSVEQTRIRDSLRSLLLVQIITMFAAHSARVMWSCVEWSCHFDRLNSIFQLHSLSIMVSITLCCVCVSDQNTTELDPAHCSRSLVPGRETEVPWDHPERRLVKTTNYDPSLICVGEF